MTHRQTRGITDPSKRASTYLATLEEQTRRVKAIPLSGATENVFDRAAAVSTESFLEAESGEGEHHDTEAQQRHGLGPKYVKADTLQKYPTDDDQEIA